MRRRSESPPRTRAPGAGWPGGDMQFGTVRGEKAFGKIILVGKNFIKKEKSKIQNAGGSRGAEACLRGERPGRGKGRGGRREPEHRARAVPKSCRLETISQMYENRKIGNAK